ncbi:MAG: hypothetical protein IK104_04325 [Clostridia bacterium]|nr:hypothetical protein [Clostridia bacterium]
MARGRRGAYDYLNDASLKLAKTVYKLTSENCGGRGTPDVKTVKELEGLVKEAAGICLSLEKSGAAEVPEIRVVFDDGIAELAE